MKGEWAYSPTVKCRLCGRVDEGVVVTRWLWIFPVKVEVCERCISKMFRTFKRER